MAQALLIADWQRDTQNWDAHPRAVEARADGIQGSIFLPVFDTWQPGLSLPAAVIEASQAGDAACPLPLVAIAEELCCRIEVWVTQGRSGRLHGWPLGPR